MIGEQFSSPTLQGMIINSGFITEDSLCNLENRCPCLDTLEFHHCKVDIKYMYELADAICKLTKLKKLVIDHVYELELVLKLEVDALKRIADRLSNLQYFELCCSRTLKLSNRSIHNLAAVRRDTLKEVILLGCDLTDEGVSCFSLCAGLTRLQLSCTGNITDFSFEALKELNLKILELDCSKRNTEVSSQALSRFFKSSRRRNLKKLFLDGFSNMNEEVIKTVCHTCTSLTDLSLWIQKDQVPGDEILKRVVETLPNLQFFELRCSRSLKLFNRSIQNLTSVRQETLKEVILSGCDLTDEGVCCLSLCAGLTRLQLCCTGNITDASFDALKELNFQTIELECFRRNTEVSSQALSRFFKSSCRSNLRKLFLDGFSNLNEEVVKIVCQTCTNLTDLSLGIHKDQVAGDLDNLVKYLSNLSYLNKNSFVPFRLFT